jgi:hypothetical protein
MLRPYQKGNALAPSWQSGRISLGEFGIGGGRVACVPTKTATTADGLGLEAVVTSGVWSNGMSGRKCGGTDEILCSRCCQHRKRAYKA